MTNEKATAALNSFTEELRANLPFLRKQLLTFPEFTPEPSPIIPAMPNIEQIPTVRVEDHPLDSDTPESTYASKIKDLE